jgi:hypothetical protein
LPVASSPIGKLVRFQESQGKQILSGEGGAPSKPFFYRKAIHGRTLDLMVQSVALEGGYINGCRMWDFEVNAPPPVDVMARLRPGEASITEDDGLLRMEWPSSGEAGMQGLQIVHMTSSNRLAKLVGASGLNLKIAFIGVDQE